MNNKASKPSANAAAAALGRLGGNAVVKKHGRSHMRSIGRRGARQRWSKEKPTNN